MFGFLKRIAGAAGKRSLDAAGTGRRFEGVGRIHNLNNTIFQTAHTVRARAAHLCRNHPNIAAGVDALVGSAIGTGLQPVPRHPDPAVRDALSAAWRRWTDEADLAGRLDFEGLQALAARSVFEAGEAFIGLVVTDEGLRLRPIPPDQVPLDHHANFASGGMVRAGVEFDPIGRVVAFHIYPQAPGDPLQALSIVPTRVPADDVCHVFEPRVAGQVRGLSRIASVMLRAIELDGFEDAALMRSRVANLLAGFVTDKDGTAFAADVDADGGLPFEPGTLTRLPPGASIEWSDPPDPSAEYEHYVRAHLRALAAGLGTTYEAISSDYSATNYSSARAAMVDMRRKVEQFQYLTFAPQFLNKVWRRWLVVEALRGTLPPAALDEPSCDWLAPKWENPDPKASAETEELELRNGLKSRTQAANERGIRVEDLDAQIAADRAREKELGLTFGAAPKAATESPPKV